MKQYFFSKIFFLHLLSPPPPSSLLKCVERTYGSDRIVIDKKKCQKQKSYKIKERKKRKLTGSINKSNQIIMLVLMIIVFICINLVLSTSSFLSYDFNFVE